MNLRGGSGSPQLKKRRCGYGSSTGYCDYEAIEIEDLNFGSPAKKVCQEAVRMLECDHPKKKCDHARFVRLSSIKHVKTWYFFNSSRVKRARTNRLMLKTR